MNIQAKIKSRGFTIAQVAARMKNNRGGFGISQGSLSTALNGNPSIDKLKEVAEIIGMSLSELVSDNEDNFIAFVREDGRTYTFTDRQEAKRFFSDQDGLKYRYKSPRDKYERMAMLELQEPPAEDGMCSVRNVNPVDSDTSEVYDEDFSRLEPM